MLMSMPQFTKYVGRVELRHRFREVLTGVTRGLPMPRMRHLQPPPYPRPQRHSLNLRENLAYEHLRIGLLGMLPLPFPRRTILRDHPLALLAKRTRMG